MNLSDYIKSYQPYIAPRIQCKDGSSLSVQASPTHCCTPRYGEGPWSEFEVGYPSTEPTPALAAYAECPDDRALTDTVYGYVPEAVVLAEIEARGGWVGAQ